MEARDKIRILSGHLEEADVVVINKALEEAHKAGEISQLQECLKSLVKADGAEDLKTLERNITELLTEWQAKLKEWGY